VQKGVQQVPSNGLGDYWQKLKPRRWIVVACLVAGWVVGLVAGLLLPPRYRSETVILIEQQKVPEHYVEPNVTADLQARLQSMSEQILSRTRLLGLIEANHLYGDDKREADADSLIERMRKDINIELVKTEGRRDVSAFKISYSAATPKMAQRVTSQLTSLFIDENLHTREELSEDTTTFLESQLNDARQSLAEQEQRLRQFRSRYQGQLPEQLQGNLQILAGLQSQLQAATDALSQAQQQNLYLRSLAHQSGIAKVSTAKEGAGSAEGATPGSIDEQIATVMAQLESDSARYTPRHPDVLRDKAQLAQLQALKARLIANANGHKDSKVLEGAEVAFSSSETEPSQMAQIAGQLSANELEIANQKTKVKKLEEEIQQYQSRLNAIPAREQESSAITRDYDQSRAYYDSLLAKKLQSEMATNLEKRREGEQFRMIDPPNLPQRPYSPNRLAFALGGSSLGAAIGIGLALLLGSLTPRLYKESELYELLSSPVTVITVPTILTNEENRKSHRIHILEGVLAGLLVIIMPIVTLFTYYKA
jgi:polysaccharide chain length determinant protein (PEP-CTERM system associated)